MKRLNADPKFKAASSERMKRLHAERKAQTSKPRLQFGS
jgi:hypothetical protein